MSARTRRDGSFSSDGPTGRERRSGSRRSLPVTGPRGDAGKACAAKTASTDAAATGIASAVPARDRASGTTRSRIARIGSSGSTAITDAYRRTSRRVSLPVPAPRSRTVAVDEIGRRSSSWGGQSGLVRSYSSAANWKLRPWSGLRLTLRHDASTVGGQDQEHRPVHLLREIRVDATRSVRSVRFRRDVGVEAQAIVGIEASLELAQPGPGFGRVGRGHPRLRLVQLGVVEVAAAPER
jgi:hypothetical protein